MGQLVEADEKKLRALVAINVVFVAAIPEAGGRAILPGHNVFGFVKAFVQARRNVTAKV
jgi:hypothetical protein